MRPDHGFNGFHAFELLDRLSSNEQLKQYQALFIIKTGGGVPRGTI